MARPLRIEFFGALYHVTSRGDRREAIFEDDEDRDIFLSTLAGVVERINWVCQAYCLMTNHYRASSCAEPKRRRRGCRSELSVGR